MQSSSPTGSSPTRTPFTGSASRRYNSNVYSRRPTLGSSAVKRARRSETPDTASQASTLTSESEEDEQVEETKGALSVRQREAVRRKDDILTSPKAKSKAVFATDHGRPERNGSKRTENPGPSSSQQRKSVSRKASHMKSGSNSSGDGLIELRLSKVSPIPRRSTPGAKPDKQDIQHPRRTDTVTSISSAPESATSTSLAVPPITVQPATSSPSVLPPSQAAENATPSTPPRKRPRRDPFTPSSGPRDISGLFAPVSPAKSPAGSNMSGNDARGPGRRAGAGGLLKRMLDKSQSLGGVPSPRESVDEDIQNYSGASSSASTPTKSLGRTHSMPSTPSRSPLKDEVAVQATSLIVPIASSSRLEPPLAALTSGSGGNRKRTYGRSRTMLAEIPNGNDSPASGISSIGEQDVVKESYAELRKQFEVDNSGDDSGQGNLMLDLLAVRGGQTVSDLRSKGENRRFMDELGYLVDPILDPSTSMGLKRSSIFDILRSMQDDVWLQRAKICGQVERIWEAIYDARGETGDELTEAMSLLYLANLVKSGSGLDTILRSHGKSCVAIILGAMKVKDGPLDELCRVKIAGLVVKVRSMYQKLATPWTSTSLSTRRLASSLLVEITSPQMMPTVAPLLSAEKGLSRTIKSMSPDLSDVSARFDLVESGLGLFPDERRPDIDHISQCLTVISRLISHEAADRDSLAVSSGNFAASLLKAVVAGVAISLNGKREDAQRGSNILLHSLQILAAMCTASSEWCRAIADFDGGLTSLARALLHRSIIIKHLSPISRDRESVPEEDNPFLSPQKARIASPAPPGDLGEEDLLCLVLAILTTAATTSAFVSDALASLNVDAQCTGTKACLRHCRCANAESVTSHLTKIYLEHATSQSPTASLIAAYLALLLAQLAIHDSTCRQVVLAALPGSDNSEKITHLIEVLSDLGGLQMLLQTRLGRAVGDLEDDAALPPVQDEEQEQGAVRTVIQGLRDLLEAR